MAYIYNVELNNGNSTDNYLIEPRLYGTSSYSNGVYTVTLDSSFTYSTGVVISTKITTTNAASATLKVNSLEAKSIYYNNALIEASVLKLNHTYSFVYNGTTWELIGDIDTNTQRPIGTGANDAAAGNHGHGNITNDGKMAGSTASGTVTTSHKFLREDGTWVVPSYTVDTWRGIQNNLTSSNNTTESLSAKQGYLLASGSARDDTKVLKSGDTMTGTLNLTPASGEGGEIHLNASTAQTAQAGIVLDQQSSKFRIFGIASADGTSKTGTGTPLVIDPYGKTITGGYTLTGTLDGNASTATSWANARKVYVALGTASKTTTINGGASNAAAIALGIDGTLDIGHGGTNATTAQSAIKNLFTDSTVTVANGDFTDNTIIITSNNSGSTDNWYQRAGIKMWNYIKSKADSTYAGINALAVANALVYKGVIAGAATGDNNAYGALTPAANCGDTYKVSVAGFINGLHVEVGDMLICTTDNTAAATDSGDAIYTTIRNNWNIIQTSEGSVSTSSTSSTDNAIARFDGTSGRIIQDSGITINDSNILTIPQTTNGGYLYKNYTSASTTPAIVIGSNNQNVNLIRVYSSDGTYRDDKLYGFNLRYMGAGSGVNNELRFYADNQTGTETIAISMNQSGQVGIKNAANTSYSLYVNGATYINGATTINNNLDITAGTIYFGKSATNKAILAYNSNNTKFGIWYHEGDTDVMRFSASGNADSNTTADFAINALGAGILSNRNNRIPHTGNTTGTVGGADSPVYVDGGQIKACTTYANATVAVAGKATNDSDGNAINTTYLKKSGGTMTGAINRYYSSANSEPMITLRSTNLDVYLFRVGHATSETGTFSNNYALLYNGVGGSPDNYLYLQASTASTTTNAIRINENGLIYFGNTTDATATNDAAFTIAGGVGIAKKLYVGSTANINGATTIHNSTNASATGKSSQLIIQNDITSGTNTIAMEFIRGTSVSSSYCSWQILISGGDFYFKNNYSADGTSAGSTYDRTVLQLVRNTGNAIVTGDVKAKTFTVATNNEAVAHLLFGRSSYNYIAFPSGGELCLNGNSSTMDTARSIRIGLTTDSNGITGGYIYPGITNKVALGSSDLKWSNVYATTFTGNLSGNATSATGVIDAGKSDRTLTIRYGGNGASATDWIPMHDSNGNLVPVSSTNLANKIRDKASGSWGISITGTASSLTAGESTGDYDRPVWFSYQENGAVVNGKLGYNNNFTYNPSSKTLKFSAGATLSTTGTDTDLTLSGKRYTYLTSGSTMYISNAANTSLIFRRGTTEYARFNTQLGLVIGGPESGVDVNTGISEKLYVNGKAKFLGEVTATAQIKTSFKDSIATGSYASSQTTIPNLLEEVRYSSGCMGSFSLGTAYTLNNITIAKGWYNFMYIPHRSGGINGAASGDNCDYGILYLHRMNASEYANYVISYSNKAIQLVDLNASFKSSITDGQILISDGTSGHIKTSGYTIATSVPSNAVFTDHYAWADITGKPSTFAPTIGTTATTAMAGNTVVTYVAQGTTTTGNWRKVILAGGDSQAAATTAVVEKTNQVYQAVGISAQPSTGTLHATIFDGESLSLKTAASNPSLSAGARILFGYTNATPQTVGICYTPNDSYRSPAGLKIMGGTSATPAWLEVEGQLISQDYTHFNSNRVIDATLVMGARGKKPTATTTDGTTTYSGAVNGTAILTLGNNKKYGDNSSGVDDNAQGIIRLYTSSDTYGQLSGRVAAGRNTIYASTGISLIEDAISVVYRAHASYYTYSAYETSGNEALVFGTQNAVTSFIFVNGESYANVSAARWTKLDGASGNGPAPGLQIKKNCVSIGELIASNTNPSYKLNVKGTTNLNGDVTVTGVLNGVKINYCVVNNSTAWNETNAVKEIFGTTDNNSSKLTVLRMSSSAPEAVRNNYASGIAWKGSDTYGMLTVAYGGANVKIAGGNGSNPLWWFGLNATSGKTYTFPSDSKTLAAADGSNASGTGWAISITGDAGGNAATATKLKTAVSIWGNSFDGSASIAGDLDWDSDTYRQRIHITDDSTADTAVFTFQQSENSGTNYSDLFTIKDNGNIVVGKRITTTSPTSAVETTRIQIIPYYHTGGPWYIASKDDKTYAYLTIKYGENERVETQSSGRISISSTVGAGSTTNLGILNIKTTATISSGWSWGINHTATGLAAGANTCLITGVADSTNNSAVFGFHYAGSNNNGNYAEISLYNNNGLLKVFKTGQVSITTNITSSSTSTGSLIVAGGAGIAGKLYVGDTVSVGTTTTGPLGLCQTDGLGLGLSLYNGPMAKGSLEYGIMFAKTGTFGTCGSVTGTWATYFTMNRVDTRGWVFKSNGGAANGNNNVASIAANGNIYTTGSLTIAKSAAGAIYLSRSDGPNWIQSTANVIAFCANSASLTSANSALRIGLDTVDGYNNNYAHLGSSSVQWKDVHSYKYIVEEKVTLQWNATDQSLDFVFA